MKRRSLSVAVLLVLLVGGVVGLVLDHDPDPYGGGFCTLEGLMVDAPDGWELHRDRANDCEWTLVNAAGRRHPPSFTRAYR